MWSGTSDDVSHILLGTRQGRCVRAMSGGLEIRVLEGANVRSVAGSGCESFAGVHYRVLTRSVLFFLLLRRRSRRVKDVVDKMCLSVVVRSSRSLWDDTRNDTERSTHQLF